MWFLFATSNMGKVRDLTRYLEGADFHLASPQQYSEMKKISPFQGEVEEVGTTYEENAALKSCAYFRWAGIPTIGDDSGLEIEALGGAPGLYSARYAGENCTFDDNIAKVLQELEGVENRRAKFVCTLAFTVSENDTTYFRGELEGAITETPRKGEGFGYDPIFEVTGTGKTLAQIKQEDATFETHRVKAMNLFRAHLEASHERGMR